MHTHLRILISLSIGFAVVISAAAHADHLTVSRHALVKDAPERDAQTIQPVERGDVLALISDRQTDGYYEVELADGTTGWVYRTFVRRVTGSLPSSGSTSSPSRPTTSTQPAEGDSPFTYAGNPRSMNPDASVHVLEKSYYTIGYSDERRNPLWVCYAIGPASDFRTHARKSTFATDMDTAARVKHSDYNNGGFSRGHMAPKFAIGSRFGKAGSDSTFVMSNVCPQYQNFNDGQWGDLEEMIGGTKRPNGDFIPGWADEYEFVWVIVGPIFDRDREPLDKGVDVPSAFYCIVLDEDAGVPRVLAFIMEHKDERDGDLLAALRPIDEVEERTGLDFFTRLPDDIEAQLEGIAAQDLWPRPDSPH